ncbi:Eukaryotic translation initiation factor isoform 4G-2 [Acorus gramineus]|uniref:Eukaryotic translation initiation factor isoform 4G-2 n=1 Tax=Acorus gramineus TaxID=55184 RepID=A0AAV9AXC3_ACOGR|nr:Eukaryotic translation initiation factor isoform 4G-2 [Acorus gramineus]
MVGCALHAEAPSSIEDNLTMEEDVLGTIEGILNQMTPENYDSLKGDLIYYHTSSITKTPDILKMMLGVTALILEKAITEPTLCPMYALLCSDLNQQLWSTNLSEPSEREKITFQRVLLNYCQEAFESTINLQMKISHMDSLDQRPKQMQSMAMLRPLKNICLFMGELYKVKLLTSRIVSSVIKVGFMKSSINSSLHMLYE